MDDQKSSDRNDRCVVGRGPTVGRISWLLLTGLLTAATTVLAKPDSVCTVIDSHNPVPTIVIGANCTKSEKFAAEELADHLQQISGRKLEIVEDNQEVPAGKKIIAVGKSKLTEQYDLAPLGVEQYIIDVQPDRLVIIGGREEPKVGADGTLYVRDRGTLYGVYDLLEQLGVRWYRPEAWGIYVPSLTTIELPLGKTTSATPAYVLRSGLTVIQRERTLSEMKAADLWMVRNRSTDVSSDPRYGGRPYYTYSHSYPDLFPPDKYFDQHPEYYALRDGKRDSSRGFNLCLSNPELQQVFAEKIIALAKAHPEWDSFALEPSDGGGKTCQCPLCKAMDDPKHPDNESNRLAIFNDIIARKVAAELPGVKVAWLAYSLHTEPPTVIDRLEPNAIIMPCSINYWGNYSKKLSDDPANANFLKVLQGWYALHPAALMTWEYWSGYGWPGPLPLTRTMADRLRNYRQYNVTGVQNETHPQWGPQGLDLYMFAKLVWNPDLDVDHELELYYQNYYGPAAKPMKAYHETLMNEVEKHDVRSGGRGMHTVVTPALLETLGTALSEAQALVKGQPLYERRLAGVAAGYEFSNRVSQIVELKKAKQDTQAEQAYQDLKQFLQSFQEGDAIFDIDPKDKTSDEPVSFPLIYLTLDLGVTWKPATNK